MGEKTGIIWTHHTFNSHWGCTRVSPACTYCYAADIAERYGTPWGKDVPRRIFGDQHWKEPLRWDRSAERAGERRRVFCASMADVFEDRRDLDPVRERLWPLIESTSSLDWLLLTKRPQNMTRFAPSSWGKEWPKNVWAGTTVEDQKRADERIPSLGEVPARVRFLSIEPLLAPVDLDGLLEPLHWVITGGESGRHLLKVDKAKERALVVNGDGRWSLREDRAPWLRTIRDQCVKGGVRFFHKQNGGPNPHSGGRLLDGRTWDEFPDVDTSEVHIETGKQADIFTI